MKHLTLPLAVALALGLGATGVVAQSKTGDKMGSDAAGKQAQSGATGGTEIRAMSQEKLTGALEKAGFTDVKVVGADYVVHAKTEDGDTVVMYINPPPVAASSATGAGSGTSGASGSGQMGSGGASGTPGNTPSGSDSKK